MYKYTCKKCGKPSFSASDPKRLKCRACPYCGYDPSSEGEESIQREKFKRETGGQGCKAPGR